MLSLSYVSFNFKRIGGILANGNMMKKKFINQERPMMATHESVRTKITLNETHNVKMSTNNHLCPDGLAVQ